MSLQYALLGLLGYSPMAGYDLKKIFDSSISFFWDAHTSQIYRELKDLESNGFVMSEMAQGEKGPDKRVYRITDSGKARFSAWLADFPEPVPQGTRNEFLVRVFFGAGVGFDALEFEMRRKLKQYRKERESLERVEAQMLRYAEHVKSAHGTSANDWHYWKICMSLGKHSAEANIAWAEETIVYLEELKKEKNND